MERPFIDDMVAKRRDAAGRSFVVQLESNSAGGLRALCGRVENIGTGEFRLFSSLEELDEFLLQSARAGG